MTSSVSPATQPMLTAWHVLYAAALRRIVARSDTPESDFAVARNE
jgi:hypothetical protein